MYMSRFNLIFSGEIAPDFELSDVQLNFKNYFHLSEMQVKYIFSGKDIILKKNLNEAQVLQYAIGIDEIGGVTYYEPVSEAFNLPEGVKEERRKEERRKKTERRKSYRSGIVVDRRLHTDRRKK